MSQMRISCASLVSEVITGENVTHLSDITDHCVTGENVTLVSNITGHHATGENISHLCYQK